MVRLFAGIVALFVATATHAGERLVVVELFTSQGCSSCPPADAMVGELAEMKNVLPLSLHVDYWDYIGWKDLYASPVFTRRQKAYARAAGERSVYTPQIIVGGVDHVMGVRPIALVQAIDRHASLPEVAAVTVKRTGDRITVTVDPLTRLAGSFGVFLVRYAPLREVAITRGENAGRTLAHHNVVDELTEVGRWNGAKRFEGSVPVRGEGEIAAIVQEGYGPVLAAARLR